MASVIAVSNQKGGVGKTTTVVNCAAFAALAGKRTLVIDNDPQGNATSGLLSKGQHGNVYAENSQPIPTPISNLAIIPGGPDLLEAERMLSRRSHGQTVLRQRLSVWREQYDVIFIDCPPNLSLLPTNALVASDKLLIPINSEYFALEGLSQLLAFIDGLRQDLQIAVELAGVLLTMHDPALPMAQQIEAELRAHFGSKALASTIPRDVALAAAPSHGQPIAVYDPLSRGALAYLAATKELLHGAY